ncbi:MAG: hypothetical protein HOJ90_03405 [Alphaproteobacteria bacterium]|nr:hypothetical protein [Alphaproteobacteria bacterium]
MERRHSLVAFLILVIAQATLRLAQADVWDDASDVASGVGFIPVELSHGSVWDGNRTQNQAQADLNFGDGTKRITGPKPWSDPFGRSSYQVYERVNKSKVQLFAVREDGGDKRGLDVSYTYSPSLGNVQLEYN